MRLPSMLQTASASLTVTAHVVLGLWTAPLAAHAVDATAVDMVNTTASALFKPEEWSCSLGAGCQTLMKASHNRPLRLRARCLLLAAKELESRVRKRRWADRESRQRNKCPWEHRFSTVAVGYTAIPRLFLFDQHPMSPCRPCVVTYAVRHKQLPAAIGQPPSGCRFLVHL